jgi:hypothetical protein
MAGRTVTVKHRSQQKLYQPPTEGLRYFKVGAGFDLEDLQVELDEYMDILLGRLDPPTGDGPMALMEFAETVHARLGEVEIAILRSESDGGITKGSRVYRFRTGELRTAQEVFAKAIDLGSRRVTYWKETMTDA